MFLVTIDGPAGVGKGTLGNRLADYYRFLFIDSGLTYRAVASLVLETGADPVEVAAALLSDDLKRHDLRSELVSNKAPDVAKIPEVREAVNHSLRRMMQNCGGVVLDGRAGGHEFPEAAVKFYLLASMEARARRRVKQLREEGGEPNYAEVLAGIIARDHKDASRATSPMGPAEDAYVINTDSMDIEMVFEQARLIVGHVLVGMRT